MRIKLILSSKRTEKQIANHYDMMCCTVNIIRNGDTPGLKKLRCTGNGGLAHWDPLENFPVDPKVIVHHLRNNQKKIKIKNKRKILHRCWKYLNMASLML